MRGLVITIVLWTVLSYLDVNLQIIHEGADIALILPTKIGSKEYRLQVSLQNKAQGVKYKNKHKNQMINFKTTSVQGHTLEGWRRFFEEVFLFAKKIYSHQPQVDASVMNNLEHAPAFADGIITFGPQLDRNVFFKKLKENAKDQIEGNVVSFYMSVNMKTVKMQLGAYEVSHARGNTAGVIFLKIPLQTTPKHWIAPIKRIYCSRERNSKWEAVALPGTGYRMILSLQSQYIILPQVLKEDIERNFDSQTVDCTLQDQLTCKGMSSIEQSMSFLSLQVEDGVYLNISLYELRQSYNEKTKISTYFIKMGSEAQLGSVILKNYYVSLNLDNKLLLYSPMNRFSDQLLTSVGVMRFLIYTVIFMVCSCLIIALWMKLTLDPKHKRPHYRAPRPNSYVSYIPTDELED